jgi:hypothetical protein
MKSTRGQRRAVLALVVNDASLGGSVMSDQQVRGAGGEPLVKRAERLGRSRGLGDLLSGDAGLGRVGGGHWGERGRLNQRCEAAGSCPRALPAAEGERGDLDGLGRVASGRCRLEVDDDERGCQESGIRSQAAHVSTVPYVRGTAARAGRIDEHQTARAAAIFAPCQQLVMRCTACVAVRRSGAFQMRSPVHASLRDR